MKKLTYILSGLVLVLLFFVSCEEYYNPKLDIVPGLLVVESHLTNNPNQNFVQLSMTSDFYNTNLKEKIKGAKVELIEIGGSTLNGIDDGSGYFTFPRTPDPGKTYMLRINYMEDSFESDAVIMPPLPFIDTLYTKDAIEKYYLTDAYGSPTLTERAVRQICIDAPITPQLEYYRFSWRAILEWLYNPPTSGFGPPPPSWYGWTSLNDKGNFNLAGPKEFSVSQEVKNHTILSLGYDGHAYLDSISLIPMGWIVLVNQYGISKNSYDFHEKLNKQLEAEGSLFDAALTQVYGNIHCINDPSKIVLGYFDLNSYRQYRYFIRIVSGTAFQRRINNYFDIPEKGYLIGEYPEFWEQ